MTKMKLIDVFVKQANKEIKDGTILKVPDEGLFGKKSAFEFEFYEGYFYHEEGLTLEDIYSLDANFLNYEVELIPPKEKEYYLRLDKEEESNYINLNLYDSYLAATKDEFFGYKTKFTQEEIDGSMLLKFIEQHGIKEEAEE